MYRTPEDLYFIIQAIRPFHEDMIPVLELYLSDIEQRVNTEIWHTPRDESLEGILQVKTPYVDIYWKPLVALLDFIAKDWDSYKISRKDADDAWERYREYYYRTQREKEERGESV